MAGRGRSRDRGRAVLARGKGKQCVDVVSGDVSGRQGGLPSRGGQWHFAILPRKSGSELNEPLAGYINRVSV